MTMKMSSSKSYASGYKAGFRAGKRAALRKKEPKCICSGLTSVGLYHCPVHGCILKD